MTKLDYEEIIELSEETGVTLEDVADEPTTPEDFERVAAMADAIFSQSSLGTRIKVARGWPAHVSARRLALLSGREREEILSHLPSDLAEEITVSSGRDPGHPIL